MPASSLKPIPSKPRRLTHALFIRLDDDTHEQLRRAANEADMPMARFARYAVRNQLEAQREAAK